MHRYADNLAEGTTSREFFWTAVNAWGPVLLDSTYRAATVRERFPPAGLGGLNRRGAGAEGRPGARRNPLSAAQGIAGDAGD
jgi:hypothetical protein